LGRPGKLKSAIFPEEAIINPAPHLKRGPFQGLSDAAISANLQK
jgi:hypothetical protein